MKTLFENIIWFWMKFKSCGRFKLVIELVDFSGFGFSWWLLIAFYLFGDSPSLVLLATYLVIFLLNFVFRFKSRFLWILSVYARYWVFSARKRFHNVRQFIYLILNNAANLKFCLKIEIREFEGKACKYHLI